MNLKTLIIARHGDYDRSGNLSEYGKANMLKLGKKLFPLFEGVETVILTSPAPRASQSAKILGDLENIVPIVHSILWADDLHPRDLGAALHLIKKQTAETLIIVTHLEYANEIPPEFAEKVLKTSARPFWHIIEKGEAVVIDCKKKKCAKISYLG